MLMMYLYTYVLYHFIKLLVNYMIYNFYFYLNFKYYIILCSFTSIYVWFMLLMLLMIINILYYLSKKMYVRNKFLLISNIYYFLYYIISLLFLLEDCMFFIVCFESMLFFMVLLSLFFIFNNSFIIALYYLIMFSMISGISCLAVLFLLFINMNLTGYFLLMNLTVLNNFSMTLVIWYFIYITFGVKFPIYPFYFWLLAVHVEVSSELSTLLAGVILKSGFMGILKFLVNALQQLSFMLVNFNMMFVLIGLLACTFNLLMITDYKKIMGSWSILHVNVTLLFLWYYNYLFMLLFMLSNLGHILSSSSFFLYMSFSYENFNNKHLFMISSSFTFNLYSMLFMLLILNNMDFPFFLLFYIELLNFLAILFISNYLMFLLLLVIIVLFVSSLLIYFVINYYHFKWNNIYMRTDMNISELSMFLVLMFYTLMLFWLLSLF